MKRKTPGKGRKTPKGTRVSFLGTEEIRFQVDSPPVQHYGGFTPTPKKKSTLSAKQEEDHIKQQLLVREVLPR